jgi:hypothetical protein
LRDLIQEAIDDIDLYERPKGLAGLPAAADVT